MDRKGLARTGSRGQDLNGMELQRWDGKGRNGKEYMGREVSS